MDADVDLDLDIDEEVLFDLDVDAKMETQSCLQDEDEICITNSLSPLNYVPFSEQINVQQIVKKEKIAILQTWKRMKDCAKPSWVFVDVLHTRNLLVSQKYIKA